jgi:lysyl-tRNA synthetase class 2
MLEWYRMGSDYRGVARDLAALVRAAGAALDVPVPPFDHLSWKEAWHRYVPHAIPSDPIEVFRAWVHHVEPSLTAPTFIWDFPADQAAFAVLRGGIAERFEFYWHGIELANAFTELRDPIELRARWTACNQVRNAAGRDPYPIDERLIAAVGQYAPAGGIAVGVDRLFQALMGLPDIHQGRIPG